MSELIPVSDIEKMANAVAKSNLFGVKTADQAMALMLIAQAEGMHPAIAARDYHVIQGKPSLKADAMFARFQQAGGKVQWKDYTDTVVTGIFSHPQGGSVEISWTIDMAKKANLTGKDTWKNYPRQMLRARVISEGIRTVYPGVAVGIYTPEEVQDFDNNTVIENEPIAKPHFKNASLRNKFVSNVIEEFENAQNDKELTECLETRSTIIEAMKATGNEHDELGVQEIRNRYAMIKKRLSAKDEATASFGEGFANIPDERDFIDELVDPAPVVPNFIGRKPI